MRRPLVCLLLPVLALAGLLAALFLARPLDRLTEAAPPVETVTVERVRLTPGNITLSVRADGSEPIAIAQVQVDGAYRAFSLDPPGPIRRLGSARVEIPYPWVEGEAHHVVLLTSTGAAFEHTIEVATETPAWEAPTLAMLG